MDSFYTERTSDAPYVEAISWSRDSFDNVNILPANSHLYMCVIKEKDQMRLAIGGPITHAAPVQITGGTEWVGIRFRLGTFMPHLLTHTLLNDATFLPNATSNSFYLHGSAWQFPTTENADTFVQRMVRQGLLMRDPLITDVLQGYQPDISLRSVQRRFVQATGVTHTTIQQIDRAHRAKGLLERGAPILDTVYETGYFDQPHLTRSLKRAFGLTPAQILQVAAAR